ncbi:hypothetical protein PRIPAC_83241 [Pristionchus pacificus]|uniref:Uncharacterized protein n=1 Tax=Pristionchus pacificus TaxID=54126 RepID=A0A2A6BMB0_PRIPA|nr:hypothetical protein PRIPAC_83241 [Pristionchus pacificus]|eukprot:PDM67035.1 hypothetical protein PRIPAC_48452 [Pristionchus pacificus]
MRLTVFIAVAALLAAHQVDCCGILGFIYCPDPPAPPATAAPTEAPAPNVNIYKDKSKTGVNNTANNAANSTNHNNVSIEAGGDQTTTLLMVALVLVVVIPGVIYVVKKKQKQDR